MARKPRIHFPDALYHVTLRVNGGEEVFADEEDRRCLEALIAVGIKRFGGRIPAYCWVSNHIILRSKSPSSPYPRSC
ncbi:MAG: hypothetical protein V3R40_02045 [Gammaproteobacteria bacterium]